MADYIGNILVPEVSPSGTFPIIPEYPVTQGRDYKLVIHQFGSGNTKVEQRYLVGTGARTWTIQRTRLKESEKLALRDFWEARKGPYQPFTFNVPIDDASGTVPVTVRFANEPLSWEAVGVAVSSIGLSLIEVSSGNPSYAVASTLLRFPSPGLASALLSQEQELIPLVYIKVRTAGYPDNLYFSDRRCIIGGRQYLPRLISHGGIGQSINGASDNASFTFGNADRVMSAMANSVDLTKASIEFVLYHIGTGIKINLWKGVVIDWSIDAGEQFPIIAADGIDELNLPYPTRKVDRLCWKIYNDGINCTGGSGLDLVHFPSANAGSCDKGYDTANGCLAHNNKRQYAGLLVKPQGVLIRDNSTGVWGFKRSSITSTSIINDSIYGQVITEIYTDTPMPVACKMASGRDESDFYNGIAVIGEGPITLSRDPLKHTLDGQSPHGPGHMGLRISSGTDPAQPNDYFSLSQVGDQVKGDWRKVFHSGNTFEDTFAAGTAFIELRRTDTKGLQLSRPTDHEMIVTVDQGLDGWAWLAPGSRGAAPGMTNPFWIAVNALLRAKGLKNAPALMQEELFDVTAAMAAAGYANDVVNALVGSGTERQFTYRGVFQEEKPLRDWIEEVLANCLGYYTWSFGKFKLGCRLNSSTVEAFTIGNIIWNSLSLRPAPAAFNYLTANFADSEFDYQSNAISFNDIDHAKWRGGATAPLYIKSQLNLSGTSSKSQALRIIATRLREELGGIDYTEWRKKRHISFRTTILALNVEPGMVCSLTHPDMPDGLGEFRVTNWRLNPDYSIDIDGITTTDSMYDLVVGPKPADVEADLPPAERVNVALPRQPWFPDLSIPTAGDPKYGVSDRRMRLGQRYSTLADKSSLVELEIEGAFPVNDLLPECPTIGAAAVSPSGGSLPSATLIFFALTGIDNDGKETALSKVQGVWTDPSLGTNRILLQNISWPNGVTGYRTYVSYDQNRLSHQSTVTGSLPSTVIISNPPNTRTMGPPSKDVSKLRFRVKEAIHTGIIGEAIAAITSTTLKLNLTGLVPNSLVGRTLSITGRAAQGAIGTRNYLISANTTDTVTVTPNPEAAGIAFGDAFVIRTKATTYSSTTIGDSMFINPVAPGGLGADWLKGKRVRITAGTGLGQVRTILSNTATVITVTEPWLIIPDATSSFIVEEAVWIDTKDSDEIVNSDRSWVYNIRITANNLLKKSLLVFPSVVYRGEEESREEYSPFEEIYIYGATPGIRLVQEHTLITLNDVTVLIDTTLDNVNGYLDTVAVLPGRDLTIKHIAGSNVCAIVASPDDTIEDEPFITLEVGESIILRAQG